MYVTSAATAADVPELMSLHHDLVGIGYDWANRLGAGGTDDYLALVVRDEREGSLAGYLGWGTFELTDEGARIRRPGPELPWVKLHALGVAPHHQRQGIARHLLECALSVLPADVLGVFGNVGLHSQDAIRWYRRRGFNIAPYQALHNPVHEHDPTLVTSYGREHHFAARREALEKYLHTDRTEEQESLDTASDPVLAFNLPELTTAPGFVAAAERIVAMSRSSCSHMAVGPRPSSITAWDPELVRVCAYCSPKRVQQLQGTDYESDDYCDGCKRSCTGITTGVTMVGTVAVQMGLCSDCQMSSLHSRLRSTLKVRAAKKTKPRRRR
ncbi:GNAT family N-acetyltransferase [Rhodococcus hoagii]|nr:GNAT family N-acetyltransferase [Prescottella equi]NKS61615.1 GNAT family N-acetyltransferase [Prescottella equi]NKZ93280.1 GNAT family N-acetyltransferase [Prescottella equi]